MRPFLVLVLVSLPFPIQAGDPARTRWWTDEVQQALEQAKDNRKELEQALREVAKEERPGLAFLIANMPAGDLTTLKAGFLLDNVRLAYEARRKTPWGKSVPEELF